MMTTQDISGKTVLQIRQREQERERRRIRDRQRRQSMTLGEREKHLARRRRNYQLRRQRADNSWLDSQQKQTSAMTSGNLDPRNEYEAVTSGSELSGQSEGITHIRLNQGQEKLNVSCVRIEGLQAGGHKLAKFPRRLRLSHIRHLARSLNDPLGELNGDNHLVWADVLTKENRSTKCSPKRVRLNYVKRFARALHSTGKESTGFNHKSEKKDEKSFELQAKGEDSEPDEDKKKEELEITSDNATGNSQDIWYYEKRFSFVRNLNE